MIPNFADFMRSGIFLPFGFKLYFTAFSPSISQDFASYIFLVVAKTADFYGSHVPIFKNISALCPPLSKVFVLKKIEQQVPALSPD